MEQVGLFDISTSIKAKAFIPDVITKELAVSRLGDKRRIVLSSNFLRIMGFEPGIRHDVNPINGMNGIELNFNVNGSQKVYEREYKTRKNNPFESQIDIQNQTIINDGVPSYTERVHFEIRRGKIVIKPLINKTFSIRRSIKAEDGFSAFVAMTSGIDARCLHDCGFIIDSLLEIRPPEKRDSNDLTETGVLNAIANVSPRLIINEDISKVEMNRIENLMKDGPSISLLHLSLACDDFSNLKNKQAKINSIESLDTSADLVYDGLRLVETIKPAVVLVENVEGFNSSAQGDLLKVKLRKWGYYVTDDVLNGYDYGGMTGRKRFYMVASVWPNFKFPDKPKVERISTWDVIEPHLHHCRNVSDCKSVLDGIKTGRIRLITPNSLACPTITKSQNRQAKDSVYIYHEGRYLMPTVDLLSRLNGIPSDLNYNSVSDTIRSEIIGQSIEYPMHELISKSIMEHLMQNTDKKSIINIKQSS